MRRRERLCAGKPTRGLEPRTPTRVHKLAGDCAGMLVVTKMQSEGVAVHGSREAVEQDFEGIGPWCATRELHALV